MTLTTIIDKVKREKELLEAKIVSMNEVIEYTKHKIKACETFIDEVKQMKKERKTTNPKHWTNWTCNSCKYSSRVFLKVGQKVTRCPKCQKKVI